MKEKELITDLKNSKALNTLTFKELQELIQLAKKTTYNNITNLICNIYILGYERGIKANK